MSPLLLAASPREAASTKGAQVLADGRIPQAEHDFRLDPIVTPTRVIRVPRARRRLRLYWDELTEEKIAAIPVLVRLRRGASGR